MKKVYLAPEAEVFEITQEQYLLSGSAARNAEGINLPSEIDETKNGNPEDIFSHSQDEGSNRAPGFFGGFDE